MSGRGLPGGEAGAGPRRQAGRRSRRGRAAEVAVPRSKLRLPGSSPQWRPKPQMPHRVGWRRRSAASLSIKTARKPRRQPPGRESGGQNVATKGCCPVTQLVASQGRRARTVPRRGSLRRGVAQHGGRTHPDDPSLHCQRLPEGAGQGDPKKSARSRVEGALNVGDLVWAT